MINTRFVKKRTKLGVAVIALLMALYFAPLCMAAGGAGQGSATGKIGFPGIPNNVVQYNKTDVTPVAEMEQVRAGEPALFCYRNTTMLMNCTRNCSVVVTVDPTVKPKLFGFLIDTNQTMTLTMNVSGSPLEGARVMERTLNFYLGVEPNATLQLRAQIRLYINQTELNQELNREVNVSRLTWMYWNRTRAEWEAVPSYMDEEGYLVCNTDHFSTWTVAEIEATAENAGTIETTDTATSAQNEADSTYIYTGVAAAAIMILAIGLYVRAKRK
ncbi:MAG: hypothetical protein ACPLIG_01575 [Candidatus Bathyarchaeales archaeon]